MPEFEIEAIGGGGGKRSGIKLDKRKLWMLGIAGTVLLAFLTVLLNRKKPGEDVVIDYGSYEDAAYDGMPLVTPGMLEQLREEQLARLDALAKAQNEALEQLTEHIEQTRQEQETKMSQLAFATMLTLEQLSSQFDQRLAQLASDMERRVAQLESYAVYRQRTKNPATSSSLPSDAPSWLRGTNAVYYAPTREIAGGSGGGYIVTETREQMEEFARGGSRNVGGSYSMDFRDWTP